MDIVITAIAFIVAVVVLVNMRSRGFVSGHRRSQAYGSGWGNHRRINIKGYRRK